VKEHFNAKNAILIGHSMGCRVISEAFQQSPTNVVGLVYVDGSLLGGDPETAVNRAKEVIDRSGMDALTQRLFNDMFLEGSDLKLRDRLVARALSVDAKFREELFLDTIRWDVTKAKDALNAINVPVLVLQATYLNSADADAAGNDDAMDGCGRKIGAEIRGEGRPGIRTFRNVRSGAAGQRRHRAICHATELSG
jgi:pimeloyl-ACP methyl ester carboxylesterase